MTGFSVVSADVDVMAHVNEGHAELAQKSPLFVRAGGEIFPGGMHWTRSLRPPTAPTAWRTGSPDRKRSPRSPVLTEPRRPHLNGWIWIPHGFMIMLLLCVSQKLSTFIDISVSLHRRFQINRTFQI